MVHEIFKSFPKNLQGIENIIYFIVFPLYEIYNDQPLKTTWWLTHKPCSPGHPDVFHAFGALHPYTLIDLYGRFSPWIFKIKAILNILHLHLSVPLSQSLNMEKTWKSLATHREKLRPKVGK